MQKGLELVKILKLDFIIIPERIDNTSANKIALELNKKIKAYVSKPQIPKTLALANITCRDKFIVIASSTGGVEALDKILSGLPENVPPILIVQHMASGFTKLFADRLNKKSKVEIREASSYDYLRKGLVLIAPADKHMTLVVKNNKLFVDCFVGTRIVGLMPAADVLFDSVADLMLKHSFSSNVLAIVLTGMGADGAKGILKLKTNGAYTIGQDQKTCMVYGMPKVAFELGAIQKQVPLEMVPKEIIKFGQVT
jgi:two-component system, chemotaxis family, protein-glutamate methylesterase/glutaminase